MIERFVRGTDGPLFAVYAPAAPHDPATPAARHADAFDDLETWRPPSYWEEDLSDKPRWMRRIPEESAQTSAEIETLRRNQYRALLAVDEAVARIVDALADTGRLSNTLIVYTSDNGLAWGEHRWRKKEVPYEESIRVPMVVRFDPLVTDGRDDPSLVLNLDLAPSVAEAAGVEAPGAEGRSFLSLMASGDEPWRRDFLVEHMEGANPVPTYCAVRGERYVFARYATGEEELYDLALDPFQLTNRVEDPAMTQLRDTLRARLLELCDPPPPGLDLPFARPGPGPGVVGGALVGSLLALLGVGAVLSRRGAVARPR
jgi:N-acetylglucosamine-6-sulfatase